MIYNVAFDPSLVSYTQAYENSLYYSPRFQQHATALARRLVKTYGLYGRDVLAIGCGKGEFLTLLCTTGHNRGVGFDPSYTERQAEAPAGTAITFVPDYYSEHYADYTADFICCRQVLEHIQHPRVFLEPVRQAAAKRVGTAVFFEVPNALYTLRDLGIWDIIYEHCSYYTPPSLVRLFCEAGFTPREVYTTFGEQFLCLEASLAGGTGAAESCQAHGIEGLRRLVQDFAGHYRAKVAGWERQLNRLLANGKCVAIWGAGSKGVTFLNTIRGGRRIRHVIDINPRKQGMYVAGTGQQILPPERLIASHIDTLLVMNPLYRDEIQAQLAQIGMFPEIQVV
jgi:SAM-dependent methyltransferase